MNRDWGTLNSTGLQIVQGSGTFDGTPWFDVVDNANEMVTFYFLGDLYIPSNSLVVAEGDYAVKVIVGDNVILGLRV